MKFHLGKLEVRIHPLLPLAMLLMTCLGAADGFLTAFVCVVLHELGHLAAAILMKLSAASLEIMPLGGVLHISGLYRLSAAKLLLLSAAGPVVSLSAAMLAVCYPELFSLRFALTNLLLCAFNLLPGMPMDGGRMLAALLRAKMGVCRSVRIAVLIGRCIGTVLLAMTVWLLFLSGRLVLPAMLMGVYLLACAGNELQDCELSSAEDLSRLLSAGRMCQPAPVQAYCCAADTHPDELLRIFRPDRFTILFYDEGTRWETDMQWLRRQISS